MDTYAKNVNSEESESDVQAYTGDQYDKRYNRLHKDMSKLSDEDVSFWKDYFGRYSVLDNDFYGIGISACNDVLSER